METTKTTYICDYCKKIIKNIEELELVCLKTEYIRPRLISSSARFHFHQDCLKKLVGKEQFEEYRKAKKERDELVGRVYGGKK